MWSDLKFSLASLRKAPGFVFISVLTLGVGIGAATSMFSALRALVVTPFSNPRSAELVQVWSNDRQPFSVPDFLDMREQAKSFSEFGVYSLSRANLGGDQPQSLTAANCTAGALRALGVAPQLGRWLEPSDEVEGAAPVAVLSHSVWSQVFGSDPAALGRSIRLNGGNVTVVGVMPQSFDFVSPWLRTEACEVWMPLQFIKGRDDRGSHWLAGIGRLKPGATVASADAEVKVIGRRLAAAYPDTNTGKPFLVRSLKAEMTREMGAKVWLLFGAVSLVLLVACANVASMLLARGTRRHGEFGLRVALGASRMQVMRLALAESAWLATGGALLGVTLAAVGIRVLAVLAPISDSRKAAMHVDLGILGFALAAAVVTAILAGIPPAWTATRLSLADMLRTEGRGAAGSRSRHVTLRALIVGQIAVALVLANGAAIFSGSYAKLLSENQSLSTDNVLSLELSLRGSRYEKTEDRVRAWELLVGRAAQVPGVSSAAVTTKLPLEGGSNSTILVNDEVFDPKIERILAEVSAISPQYFATAGIPLLRGRTLSPADETGDIIGMVVNRALAEKAWPGQDPLGKIIRPNSSTPDFKAQVVGVVENVRQWGVEYPAQPEMYWTPNRAWGQRLYLLVRSDRPVAQLTAALRREITRVDSDLAPTRPRTLRMVVHSATQSQRAIAVLVDFFMATALGLVVVGLYGTLSYHVLQRTRELGVRLAVGASRGNILSLVIGQGARWAAVGVAIGLLMAVGSTFGLKSLVYGLSGVDTGSMAIAVGGVALAACAACLIPAWRASRLDPVLALRTD